MKTHYIRTLYEIIAPYAYPICGERYEHLAAVVVVFILLVLYQIKHFLCDFPLQTPYILGKFKKYPDFIKPLLAHAAMHGFATFLIALLFKPEKALFVAAFDMCTHFVVDRIKASPDLLGRFKALSSTEYKQKMSDYLSYKRDGKLHYPRAKSLAKDFKSNVYFWWALGADQGLHHLTHYIIIWNLL